MGIGILLIFQLTGQIVMATAGTGMINHNINHFGDTVKSQVECVVKTTTNNNTYSNTNIKVNTSINKSTTQYGEKNFLTGKVTGELAPHGWYLNRLNNLARDYNEKLNVYSGYRSFELQRQLFNDSDRSGKFVAPAGKSRHQVGLAVDIDSKWVKELNNKQLAKYGLYKPMSYEDWHIEPVETKGKSTQELISHYGIPSDKILVNKYKSETKVDNESKEKIHVVKSLIQLLVEKEITRIETLKANNK